MIFNTPQFYNAKANKQQENILTIVHRNRYTIQIWENIDIVPSVSFRQKKKKKKRLRDFLLLRLGQGWRNMEQKKYFYLPYPAIIIYYINRRTIILYTIIFTKLVHF